MSDFPEQQPVLDAPTESKDVPYETFPELAANERFVQVAEELRRLKQLKDTYFEERKDPATGKKRPSYWDEMKLEAGAIAAAAGARSVAFIDLRIAQTEPGAAPMKVTGPAVVAALNRNPTLEELAAIAQAAKDCDPDMLVACGIPAHIVGASRVPVGKPRAGSTRIEWIGKRGSGGGGSVQ